MTRGVRLATVVGIALMLAGLGLLIADAQHRVNASTVTISLAPGATVGEKLVDENARRAQAQSVGIYLFTGIEPRPQHWKDFRIEDGGGSTYEQTDSPGRPFTLSTPAPKLLQPAALPFATGLGVLIGTLFIAAARWRPRA